MTVTTAIVPPPSLIRWHYWWYVAAATVVMIAAIASGDRWFLNFIHVFSGLMWTGIDIFMGFILGPVLQQVDLSVRREVALRLTPRTLFLMPTLAFITGTTGWYLTVHLGFLALPWPQFGWIAAALVLITLMTIQGFVILLPTNVRVCLELQKPQPDMPRISRLMRFYFVMTASQGAMQILMIVIMARFVSGI
ncbi:MAG: hypothetical protein GEU91_15635 [Rhizobiales bacterium]|nr:hypothetical protein [Hyphomicrobiales bacterium]